MGAEFAVGFWVWSFLAADHPVPEELIAASPATLVDHMLDAWSADASVFPDEIRAVYISQFRDPARVHAICEQYRAAAALDVDHHEHDRRSQHRITCPVLALWSAAGPVGNWYAPLDVWRRWADDVRGGPIDVGHFLPEEAPTEVLVSWPPS